MEDFWRTTLKEILLEIEDIENVDYESTNGKHGQKIIITYKDGFYDSELKIKVQAEAIDNFDELVDYCKSTIYQHRGDE